MKVKDLRIGNLLRDKISKTELEVIELTKEDITTYVIDRSKYPLNLGWGLEPIELTEEWLLKMGFKHTGGGFYTHLPSLIQACNVGDKFYNMGFKDANIGRFYYVHQLQNLYHALTGEELTIK